MRNGYEQHRMAQRWKRMRSTRRSYCSSMLEVCCSQIRASALVSGSSIKFQVAANNAFDAVFYLRCWKDMHNIVSQHGRYLEAGLPMQNSLPNEEDSVLLRMIILVTEVSGHQILISPLQHRPTARSGQTSMFDGWSSCT